MPTSFDLSTPATRTQVRKIVSDLVGKWQFAIQKDTTQRVFLVVNVPLMNTAIDKAAETIHYHHISGHKISNEKKFGHLCFWMTKINPISFVIEESRFEEFFRRDSKSIQIDEEFPDLPVNAQISYLTFLWLYSLQSFGPEDFEDRAKNIFENKYSAEVIKSLRFDNFTAKTLALYLESLVSEKLS